MRSVVHEHSAIVFALAKVRQDELKQRAETHRRIKELNGGKRRLHWRMILTLGNLLTAYRSNEQTQPPPACPEQVGTETLICEL